MGEVAADRVWEQSLHGPRVDTETGLYTRVNVEDLREVLARAHPRDRARQGQVRRYNSARGQP